jgi:uncharacterized membrane protein YdbT with pleckstrin-like domain
MVFFLVALGVPAWLMILDGIWFGLAINIGIVLFIYWLYKTTKYIVTEDELEIQCGLRKQRIRWEDVRSVKYTSNPISSPAFSFRRIQIDYGRMGSVIISPHTREDFMNELRQRNFIKSA